MWLLLEATQPGLVVRAVGPRARASLRLGPQTEGQLVEQVRELDTLRPTLAACASDGLTRVARSGETPLVVERVGAPARPWLVVHADLGGPSVEHFFRRAPLPAFVASLDGTLTYCNEPYAALLGRSPGDVVGRTNRDLFGADLAAKFEARNAEVYERGVTKELVESFDTAKAGRRTYFVNLFPIRPEGDTGQGHVGGVLMDVTNRLLAQQELQLQERTMSTVLEKMSNGVWVVDADWKTTSVNRAMAEMLGRTPEQLLGVRPDELVKRDEVVTVEQLMRDRERGESISAGATTFVKPDGSEVYTLHSATPLTTAEGTFAGSVAIVMDLTDQRRREAALREAEERVRAAQKLESLGVLAGGIAHDFNNLLTGILGNLGSLKTDLAGSEHGLEGLALIEKATARAAVLCRQMLAFSGRGHFVVVPVDLSAQVPELVDLARASVDKRHAVTLELAQGLPLVKADTSQFAQVLMALVLNADEAIGARKGSITVRTFQLEATREELASTYLSPELPPGPYVCLEVADDGEGMTEAVQARLFEPYFSTRATGRGLGMPAVLGVMRGHCGAIKVTSAPGRGTTVRALFPTTAPATTRTTPAPQVQAPAPRDLTVLVVDDEPLVRSTLRRLLVRAGFRVREATDGQDALDRLAGDGHPHVVLLDLSMPRLDGVATFQELQRQVPHIPVVLMSGYSEHEAVQHFLGQGLAGFIQKPFANADVIARVNDALGRANAPQPQLQR